MRSRKIYSSFLIPVLALLLGVLIYQQPAFSQGFASFVSCEAPAAQAIEGYPFSQASGGGVTSQEIQSEELASSDNPAKNCSTPKPRHPLSYLALFVFLVALWLGPQRWHAPYAHFIPFAFGLLVGMLTVRARGPFTAETVSDGLWAGAVFGALLWGISWLSVRRVESSVFRTSDGARIKLPPSVILKNFLGIYVLTPFEQDLLGRLRQALSPADQEVLDHQLERFTTVRRVLIDQDPDDVDEAAEEAPPPAPDLYGFTSFNLLGSGKIDARRSQEKLFSSTEEDLLLATTRVTFDKGEIGVQFWVSNGVLLCIEYRSPQQIYYPRGTYQVESVKVRPSGAVVTAEKNGSAL